MSENPLFLEYPKMKTLFALVPLDAHGRKWNATDGKILPETAPLHFMPLEHLVFTEKLNGTNMGIRVDDAIITHVQRRNDVTSPELKSDSIYNNVLKENFRNIDSAVQTFGELQNAIIYGELVGDKIQGGGAFGFGGRRLFVFDIYNTLTHHFYSWDAVKHWSAVMGLQTVPEVQYPFADLSVEHVREFIMNQKSQLNPAVEAEGIVVRNPKDTLPVRRYMAKIRREDFINA